MYAISCKSNTGGASCPDILMSSRLQFMGGSGWPWHSQDFCCNVSSGRGQDKWPEELFKLFSQ